MAQNKAVLDERSTIGDAAVDGLFSGIGAGVVMAVYLGIVALISGEGLAVMFGRFAVGANPTPLQGLVLHLAVSSVYGVMFGLAFKSLPFMRPLHSYAPIAGFAYGLALLVIARAILLPMTNSPLGEIPLLHFAIAHALYGLVLGVLAGRRPID